MNKNLTELEGTRKKRIARLEIFILDDDWGEDERGDFKKELEALQAGKSLQEIENTFWWGKETIEIKHVPTVVEEIKMVKRLTESKTEEYDV